jgi:hypothetical protein
MAPEGTVMPSRNGNKWKTAVTHRDVLAVVEEIESIHGLKVDFRLTYAPAVVLVMGWAKRKDAGLLEVPEYVAKHSQSPFHAPTMETLLYRVAWDLFQQAEAGARGFKGADSMW